MRRLSASNLPVPSFMGSNMLRIDVVLQVVHYNMYVARQTDEVTDEPMKCIFSEDV